MSNRISCSEGYSVGQEKAKHRVTKWFRAKQQKRKWVRQIKERDIARKMKRQGLVYDNGLYTEERRQV